MKVIVKENKEPEQVKYPHLCRSISKDLIVLFTSFRNCTVLDVRNIKGYGIGDKLYDVDMSLYEVFDGAITLKND